jgi:hypothetical protein
MGGLRHSIRELRHKYRPMYHRARELSNRAPWAVTDFADRVTRIEVCVIQWVS